MKSDDLDNDCAKTGFASSFGTIVCNANHINATRQARLEAEARRKLEGVTCKPLIMIEASPAASH